MKIGLTLAGLCIFSNITLASQFPDEQFLKSPSNLQVPRKDAPNNQILFDNNSTDLIVHNGILIFPSELPTSLSDTNSQAWSTMTNYGNRDDKDQPQALLSPTYYPLQIFSTVCPPPTPLEMSRSNSLAQEAYTIMSDQGTS